MASWIAAWTNNYINCMASWIKLYYFTWMELAMMSVLKVWSKNSDQGLYKADMIPQKHQQHQPIMATCTNFK